MKTLCWAVIAIACASTTAGAAAEKLGLKQPSRVDLVAPIDLNDPVIDVEIESPPAGGTVEVYALAASVADRVKTACTWTLVSGHFVVNRSEKAKLVGNCAGVLAPLLAGDATELAVSAPGDSSFGVLARAGIPEVSPSRPLLFNPDDGTFTADPKLPVRIVTGGTCAIFIEQFINLTCTDTSTTITDTAARAALRDALARGDKKWLYATAIDGDTAVGKLRRIPIALQPERDDTASALFQKNCTTQAKLHPRTYFACVRITTKEQVLISYDVDSSGTPHAVDTTTVNRRFVVLIEKESSLTVKPTMNGIVGRSSGLYEPRVGAATNGAPLVPLPTVEFGPFKPGNVQLQIVGFKTAKEGNAEVARLEHTYEIIDLYKAAIRFGLAFTWLPDAVTFGTGATPNGQRVVIPGDSHGVLRTEIVTGFSYFLFGPLEQNSLDAKLALGLRIGILGVGGSGTTVLSSALAGPEVTVGEDLAVGVYIGGGRYDAPDTGYEPGRPIPNGVTAIPIHTAYTFAAALVLNFTPGPSKALGVIK